MNLSEEEIIIDVKEFINNIKEILNEGNNDLTKKVETDFYTLQVVLQGLLDLYQQEKEKNIELNKLKCFGLLDIYNMGKEGARQRIKHDWVEKDKIREKLKKYDGLKEIDMQAYEEQIKPLKELLGEK